MKNLRSAITLFGCMALSHAALAIGGEASKNEGVVHGYVIDAATKKPVAGVVVSAYSGKGGISNEVATDAAGYFKIKQLPAGDPSIQFDKKGYRNLKKEQVSLKEGMILKMNVDILSDKNGEVVDDLEHPVLRLIESI